MNRIEFKGVVKHFYFFKKDFKIFNWLYNGIGHSKEFRVLKGINFNIKDGEIVGILGANGAGKSTTLKIIAGIYTPTKGSISINGKVTSLLELGAGFNAMLSGRENIYFKGNIMGLSKEEIDIIIDDIIEFADIGEYMEMPLASYSSGMSARLGFALAVMVDPEILIIDEVFAVGDKDFQQKSREKTMEFFEQGKTILFVSHSEDLIRTFCKRVIYLKDGFIQYDGEVEKGIEMYHDDIRKKTKEVAMIYEKTQYDKENFYFFFDIGRVHNAQIFDKIDLSETEISICKFSVKKRIMTEPNFTTIKIDTINDMKIKIGVKYSELLFMGFIGFKFTYMQKDFYAYIYKGDDTLFVNDVRLRIRHASRKIAIDVSDKKE